MPLTPKQKETLQKVQEIVGTARKYPTFEEYFLAELAAGIIAAEDRNVEAFKSKYHFHYRTYLNRWELNSKGFCDILHTRAIEALHRDGHLKLIRHNVYHGMDRVLLLDPQEDTNAK